jgi:hypothetical protein
MFNKKLKDEVAFLSEVNECLLDYLCLDIEYCGCCGAMIFTPKE